MPASKPSDELRKQAADLIISRLEKSKVADVASDLGISRQAVYDIKKGKYCPSMSLVQKACEVWKVKFSFRGILIDNASFSRTKSTKQPPAKATQAGLFDALEQLHTHTFDVVNTKQVGGSVEITLRLKLSA